MSPTVRQPTAPHLDQVGRARIHRTTAYSIALLTLAALLVAGLTVAGEAWPAPGLLLVVAIPLAWCMNRYVLFPNETGVTADAAVIVASLLVFRGAAPWSGPLVVALLVGVLDVRHWRERAFVRMSYNSGSTALATATAVAAFEVASSWFGGSWTALLGAALIAAIPYIAAETAFGVVLVALFGERVGASAKQQAGLNLVALPLAALGAAAGLLGAEIGWWVTTLVLLPAPFVPEVLLVVVPRRTAAASRWAAIAVAALVTSVAVPGATVRAVAALVAITCLVVADRRPRSLRDRWLPPLLALVVTVPLAAFPVGLPVPTVAVVVAAATGALTLAALGLRAWWWTLPVVFLTAAAARLGASTGRCGVVVAIAAVLTALVVAARFGPPPWPSRLLVRVRTEPGPVLVDALAVVTIVGAIGATLTHGTLRRDLALSTTVALEAAVVVAAFAVHLWRFVPRLRVRDLTTLLVVGVAGLVLVPELVPLAAVVGAVIADRVARVGRSSRHAAVRTARDRPS